MKNQKGKLGLMMFLMMFLLAINADGQEIDQQWYVRGGNSNNIKVMGVTNANENIRSRNDLFIIFRDSNCYSNRLHSRINNNLNQRTTSSTFSGNELNVISNTSSIQYLYWTNVYDDDDPRERIRVVENSTGTGTVNSRNTQSIPSGLLVDSMFAHQDVVAGTDVVLVLPPSTESRILKYNNVSRLNDGGRIINYSILTPINVFNNTNCLGSSCNQFKDSMEIKGTVENKPVMIAFRVENDIRPDFYGSVHQWDLYDSSGTQLIDSYSERILTSHDPNYIQLLGLCEENNSKFALYRAHFENDGDESESKISFSFESPWTGYMSRSGKVCSKGGVFGGSKNKENLQQLRSTFYKPQRSIGFGTFFKRRVRHQFTSTDYSVDPLKYGNPLKATGYFEFCVQIKDDMGTSLDYKLINPTIYFNGSPLAIKKFVPDSKVAPRINNCDCCE